MYLHSHAVCLFRFCSLILKAFIRDIKLHLAALLTLKGFIKMSEIVSVTGANREFAWKFAFYVVIFKYFFNYILIIQSHII